MMNMISDIFIQKCPYIGVKLMTRDRVNLAILSCFMRPGQVSFNNLRMRFLGLDQKSLQLKLWKEWCLVDDPQGHSTSDQEV